MALIAPHPLNSDNSTITPKPIPREQRRCSFMGSFHCKARARERSIILLGVAYMGPPAQRQLSATPSKAFTRLATILQDFPGSHTDSHDSISCSASGFDVRGIRSAALVDGATVSSPNYAARHPRGMGTLLNHLTDS